MTREEIQSKKYESRRRNKLPFYLGAQLSIILAFLVCPPLFFTLVRTQDFPVSAFSGALMWLAAILLFLAGTVVLPLGSNRGRFARDLETLWRRRWRICGVVSAAFAAGTGASAIARSRLMDEIGHKSLAVLFASAIVIICLAAWIGPGEILNRLRGIRGRAWSRFVLMVAAGAVLATVAILTSRLTRDRAEVTTYLDPSARIYAEVRSNRARGPALARLGRYLQDRPHRHRILNFLLWTEPAELSRKIAVQFRSGDVGRACLDASHSWQPGDPRLWSDRLPLGLRFCLHRQAFLFRVAGLSASGDREGLERAWSFIHDWSRAAHTLAEKDPSVWSDDPTAIRIMAQLEVAAERRRLGLNSVEDELFMVRSVLEHADVLMDDTRHNYRTNHGLMQNAALLDIALEYPEFDQGRRWLQTALRRTERHARETISPDGVFLELTPGYHQYATTMFLWFLATCRAAHVDVDRATEERVLRMASFLTSILQPDSTLPAIADTELNLPGSCGRWPWQDLSGWLELVPLRTLKPDPLEPPNDPAAQLWPAGYFVLRAAAPDWTRDTGMMATLTAGPKTLAHEHYNALSLTLYARGRPLLVGPGYPDYNNEPEREIVIGTPNQNTVSVDGKSHDFGPSTVLNLSLCKLQDRRPGAVSVVAESHLYAGVTHRRALIYGASKTAVLIIDELTSPSDHLYSQQFRVPPGIILHETEAGVELLGGTEAGARLLDIRAAVLTHERVSYPGLRLNPPMAAFQVVGRHVSIVTILDCSPGRLSSVAELRGNAVVWRGPGVTARIPLPLGPGTRVAWQ